MDKLAARLFDQVILEQARDHIKFSEIWSDDDYPMGGVHIKPRPPEAKLDAVELNMLFLMKGERNVEGVMNVNVINNHLGRVNELSNVVQMIMEDSLIEGFHYRKDFYNMFKSGKYIWYHNLRFKISMSKKEFNARYGY